MSLIYRGQHDLPKSESKKVGGFTRWYSGSPPCARASRRLPHSTHLNKRKQFNNGRSRALRLRPGHGSKRLQWLQQVEQYTRMNPLVIRESSTRGAADDVQDKNKSTSRKCRKDPNQTNTTEAGTKCWGCRTASKYIVMRPLFRCVIDY